MSQTKEDISKQQRKNIFNLIMMVLLVATALLVLQTYIIPYYVNSYISQFLPIQKLNFQQNRWITINDANIYHVHRLGSVHPSEELSVELRVINPTNETLGYHPQVSVTGGNDDLRNYQDYSTWWVQPHNQSSISLPFFAGSEGDNEIKVSLQTRDLNGIKFPDEYDNSTAIFGVLSTVELLENQNSTLQNSIIISSVIGSLTFIALILTWYSSKQHTGQLELQVKASEIQNTNLVIQNKIIEKQASDQKVLTEAQLKTANLFKVFELLSNKTQVELRGEIYDYYWRCYPTGRENSTKKNIMNVPEDTTLKQIIRQVESPFDWVGALVEQGLIEPKLLYDLYAGMIVRMWYVLEEDVVKERNKGNSEICRWFENLNDGAIQYFKNKGEELPKPYKKS